MLIKYPAFRRYFEMIPIFVTSSPKRLKMTNKPMNSRFLLVLSVILAGALFRFIPHWPNFTPIAAMALVGGAYLDRKYLAFLIPLGAMFISDMVIGFHSYMVAVYIALSMTVLIGMYLKKRLSTRTVIAASVSSSVIFYLVTNFAAWLASPIYPGTPIGLMESYIAGLAFFNDGSMGLSFFLNDVVGTLFYSGLFFGVIVVAQRRFALN